MVKLGKVYIVSVVGLGKENDFLTESLMLYIEKDIVSTFSLDSIINDFEDLKERQVPFS